MKNLTVAQKMRRIAGVLYLVLCVYQMALFHVTIDRMSISSVSFLWIVEMLMVPGAAAMAVWMFGGDTVLKAGTRRAVVVSTIAVVVFELLSYKMMTVALDNTLDGWAFTKSLVGVAIWQYVFLAVQLLFMILAAFFVTSSRDSLDHVSGKAEKKAERDNIGKEPEEKTTHKKTALSTDLDKPLEVPKGE